MRDVSIDMRGVSSDMLGVYDGVYGVSHDIVILFADVYGVSHDIIGVLTVCLGVSVAAEGELTATDHPVAERIFGLIWPENPTRALFSHSCGPGTVGTVEESSFLPRPWQERTALGISPELCLTVVERCPAPFQIQSGWGERPREPGPGVAMARENARPSNSGFDGLGSAVGILVVSSGPIADGASGQAVDHAVLGLGVPEAGDVIPACAGLSCSAFLVPTLAHATKVDEKARAFSPWSHVAAPLSAQLTHAIGLLDVCVALSLHSDPLSILRGSTPLTGHA